MIIEFHNFDKEKNPEEKPFFKENKVTTQEIYISDQETNFTK